ncbi:MAG: hypothetical protein WCF23_11645 [Candidatus Nitrosopolaris sp.]
MAKIQPKYGQSVHNTILAQKQLASGWYLPEAYSEQFVKESDEITKNIVNAIDV